MFIWFNFFNDSSISFDKVTNNKSDDDDDELFDVAEATPFGVIDAELVGVNAFLVNEVDEKLLDNLLNATNFESISFSNCLACFRSAFISKMY